MTDNERLAKIETNLDWLVKEWKDAREEGFPRCAIRGQQIETLDKSVTNMKRLLTVACALPLIGGAIAKYTDLL